MYQVDCTRVCPEKGEGHLSELSNLVDLVVLCPRGGGRREGEHMIRLSQSAGRRRDPQADHPGQMDRTTSEFPARGAKGPLSLALRTDTGSGCADWTAGYVMPLCQQKKQASHQTDKLSRILPL